MLRFIQRRCGSLQERQHKRELRLKSAQKATGIAVCGRADLERTLIFELPMVFVRTLRQKAVLDPARDHLAYYDHVLDLDRLELQRVQYESDLQTAEANLRTAKIQPLPLLNDRTPIEQFDVTGPYGFSHQSASVNGLCQTALDTRPDLKAALQSVDKARLAVANGSTDPTLGFDVGRNPRIDQYIGHSVSVPLRIFDRNQGEKLRTQRDIDRNEKLSEAAQAQAFSDVDSAYATVTSTVVLLHFYKDRCFAAGVENPRYDRVFLRAWWSFPFRFLNARADYPSVQVNYLNLVASYLDAANQLNLAVGREVIQ